MCKELKTCICGTMTLEISYYDRDGCQYDPDTIYNDFQEDDNKPFEDTDDVAILSCPNCCRNVSITDLSAFNSISEIEDKLRKMWNASIDVAEKKRSQMGCFTNGNSKYETTDIMPCPFCNGKVIELMYLDEEGYPLNDEIINQMTEDDGIDPMMAIEDAIASCSECHCTIHVSPIGCRSTEEIDRLLIEKWNTRTKGSQ